jgi:sugar transferase (PEP-CTERM/EpsH1 system associated)
LFVVHRVPYPPDKGDRIRSYQLLRYLSSRSDVHLATLADETVSPAARAELERLTVRLAVGEVRGAGRWLRGAASLLTGGTATDGLFYSRPLARSVEGWLNDTTFDAIYLFSSPTAQYVRGVTPQVCDLVDVDSEKWLRYAASSRFLLSWLFRLEGTRLRRTEARLGAAGGVVALVSDAEAAVYRAFCPGANVEVVPCGVDLDYYRPQQPHADETGLVFVGAMDYRPNVQGISWFCEAAWPAVLRRHPGTLLTIVGRNPTRAVRRLARLKGVQVTGAVADVRPFLARAAAVIAPLQIARGVQNKVLEALALGKALICSPPAATGLGIRHGRHALFAEEPEQWTRAVTALLNNPSQRQALGRAGRAYVKKYHDWDRCLAPLDRLLFAPNGRGRAAPRDYQHAA